MASAISELRKRVEQVSAGVQAGTIGTKTKQEDPRFFYPQIDPKTGVGYAVIRFLPASQGSKLHWGHIYSHGFKVGNKWLIENCPTTHGDKCPICEENGELWETGLESNKGIARDRKRKETYFYNVLVVSHPANPADEGTVRIFKSGPTVFKMLLDAQKPKFPGDPVIDAWDPWSGADFVLRIYKDDNKQTKYDKSTFAAPAKMGTDEFIEATWLKCFNLEELSAPSLFKSYDELRAKFNEVTGVQAAAAASTPSSSAPSEKSEPEKRSERKAPEPAKPTASDDEDDPLKMFEDMAK